MYVWKDSTSTECVISSSSSPSLSPISLHCITIIIFCICFEDLFKVPSTLFKRGYQRRNLYQGNWANIAPHIDGKMANSTRLMSTPMSLNTKLSGPSRLKYLPGGRKAQFSREKFCGPILRRVFLADQF